MACDKNCNETVVTPTVDNSVIKCTECGFLDIECVITSETIAAISLEADSTLKDIIYALLDEIDTLKTRVTNLGG